MALARRELAPRGSMFNNAISAVSSGKDIVRASVLRQEMETRVRAALLEHKALLVFEFAFEMKFEFVRSDASGAVEKFPLLGLVIP